MCWNHFLPLLSLSLSFFQNFTNILVGDFFLPGRCMTGTGELFVAIVYIAA